MTLRCRIPAFKDDRAAAQFRARHDTTPYLGALEEIAVDVAPGRRRRVAQRAALKKPVTLRLEPEQIETAKRLARQKSVPYQTLLRMWIAEGLRRARAG